MQDQHDSDLTDIQKLEKHLAELSPCSLSENLLSRMEEAMVSWETHLPVEEKIVPFESQSIKKSYFPVWSAAAAVALMAAVGAVFMLPSDDAVSDQPAAFALNDSADLQPENSQISPHFSHHLTNASSEGITYAGDDEKPYKVFRIEYTKDVKHIDKDGNVVIKKEPSVDLILVPVEVH